MKTRAQSIKVEDLTLGMNLYLPGPSSSKSAICGIQLIRFEIDTVIVTGGVVKVTGFLHIPDLPEQEPHEEFYDVGTLIRVGVAGVGTRRMAIEKEDEATKTEGGGKPRS